MKKMVKASVLFLALLFFAASCGGSNYMAPSTAQIATSADMATIIFYRSTKYGGGIKSAIFDVTEPEMKFAGSLISRSKIAIQVPAGQYTFMVKGENDDFAQATVEAGHTYYMAVMVYPGVMKARFALNPVTKEEFSAPSFEKFDICKLYEKTPAADAWF
ncbi:MAG: hypothetical protein JXR91_08030, partial [Deltaproteobacteria bacterium]|nr:hypothetical protein [Deltaproteobacteria bacterium]